MNDEETIQAALIKTFPYLDGKIRVQRARRIFAEVPAENFMEVFTYAHTQMCFPILCTIVGLDEGESISCMYFLARENGIILSLKISVPKEAPVIKTITQFFPAAEMYEREVIDLLGIKVEGLTEGRRYPLPDNWPADQYPLRKDWQQ